MSLSIAVTVIEGYIEAHNNLKDTSQPLKHRIEFPTPFPKKDDHYLRDVCLDLYYTKSTKFNIISYSDIYFLWEKYSCRKVQCDNLIYELKHILDNKDGYADVALNKYKQNPDAYMRSIRFKERNDENKR